ncbi:MAG: V-type ATPase subunit, partial [Halobacteriaceae archaeon]
MSASASNFEYVTARVRSRRAALFDEEDYRKLLRMGPGEIARYMEDTEYEREINALGSRFSGVDLIEHALNRNLAKHFDDLLRWAEGRLYDQVARYLRKFDAWNAKTALRGKYTSADSTEIQEDYIRAGEFDDDFLDRLANAADVGEVVDLLQGTVFGDGLEGAFDK